VLRNVRRDKPSGFGFERHAVTKGERSDLSNGSAGAPCRVPRPWVEVQLSSGYSGGGGMAATTSFPVKFFGSRARGEVRRDVEGTVRNGKKDVTAACSRRAQNVCSYLRRSGSDRAGAAPVRP
jgi:hypothetical protein